MKSPAEELRQRLLAYRSAVARARLEALVSDGEADRPDPTGAVLRGCARARAALASDEALDLLD
ncbi:MAG TPA: hypothetical protein RMF84_12140, partial [Polyangiaceae bacterium LLY-WYZ-14_1]|nr:hypothetical protein [Polyangiaceae bacterium LLY-WYZ-14_1]